MASHGDPLFTFSPFQTWRGRWASSQKHTKGAITDSIAPPPPPSCFLHFFTFIYFQCFLASSLLIPCFMLQLPRASHSLPCASIAFSPAPPSFQALFPFLGSLSERFVCTFSLFAGWKRWGSFLYERELSVGRYLNSDKPRELHFHVWCPLSPLVGGNLPFQSDTESCSLKFWVMDVSSGYQGNF